jgi:clan AA aspartic protease (TIGR02281 family)
MKSRFGGIGETADDGRRDDDFVADEPRYAKRSSAIRWAMVWFVLCIGAALTAPAWLNRPAKPAPGPAAPPSRAAAAANSQRAVPANTSIFTANQDGHFLIDAEVNGAPVQFLVDTGATYVVLSDSDAEAAGISRIGLNFDHRFRTANGEVHGAVVSLRSLRIGQMEENEVEAVVMEASEPISLLGMTFLRRLVHYEIRDGQLVFSW